MGLDTLAMKETAGGPASLAYAWAGIEPTGLDADDARAREEFSALRSLIGLGGGASFTPGGIRGGHYAGLVLLATGTSLFDDGNAYMPPAAVAELARRLRETYEPERDTVPAGRETPENPYHYLLEDGTHPGRSLQPGEYGELVSFFETCAAHGYGLRNAH